MGKLLGIVMVVVGVHKVVEVRGTLLVEIPLDSLAELELTLESKTELELTIESETTILKPQGGVISVGRL